LGYNGNMDILELRSKIVRVNKKMTDANKLLIEINAALLKEFQKQHAPPGVGKGYTGNGLEFTDKRITREEPPCCGQ